jgi:hypothetical protein
MARTYREIATEEMLRTVEEAMSQVIDWWGDLPPPMKEAIEQFRTQLGAAIDSVEFVKRALALSIAPPFCPSPSGLQLWRYLLPAPNRSGSSRTPQMSSQPLF